MLDTAETQPDENQLFSVFFVKVFDSTSLNAL